MSDEIAVRRFRKQFPGAVEFDCDGNCGQRNFTERIEVYPREGEDLIIAVEAAAEADHFLATGCRGRVRLRGPTTGDR